MGSHHDVARLLHPAGTAGIAGPDLDVDTISQHRPIVNATGKAGDVFLCHPFLVHAAQLHRGTRARLIAQPGVLVTQPFALDASVADVPPVEQAILNAIAGR